MRKIKKIRGLMFLLGFSLLLLFPALLLAQEDLKALKEEMRQMKEDRAKQNARMEMLEKKIDTLETQQSQKTEELEQKVEARIKDGPSPSQFSSAFSRYLGSQTFLVGGAAALDYIYDWQSGGVNAVPHNKQNTYVADWEPMILYRPNDWMLFQGILKAAFGSDGTRTDLSSLEFHLFPNNYVELLGGLFDNPFGDWYETQSPMWTNRFITAPLPFGVEGVVPAGEMGIQARGGFQWGEPGQDWDYTVWTGNGPSFSQTGAPAIDVPGATMTAPTAVGSSRTHSKSVGARLRFYPIPLSANWGRLEVGASTYDGKWLAGRWLNAWGIDYNYFIGNLQTRGEYLRSYRQMPAGMSKDNRDGGYLQLGYFLNGLDIPALSETVSKHVRRLEPLVRFSWVNQRAVVASDIGPTNTFTLGLVPDFGVSHSPALFAPHSRELALGLDYWIAPSIVWQNEFDFELPRMGGKFIDATGASNPGRIHHDHVFLTQFTIGF